MNLNQILWNHRSSATDQSQISGLIRVRIQDQFFNFSSSERFYKLNRIIQNVVGEFL